MQSTRFIRAGALVVVARVLVKKRWQDGAADHDVRKAVGGGRAKAFAVTLPPLLVVGNIRRLVDPGKHGHSEDSYGIGRSLQREPELEFRCERRGVVIVDNIEIRKNPENTLLLLDLDLLGSNLFGE